MKNNTKKGKDNEIKRFLKEFCKLNDTTLDSINYRIDGRIEWICDHGVGHTIYSKNNYFIHGCDGCCFNLIIPKGEIK